MISLAVAHIIRIKGGFTGQIQNFEMKHHVVDKLIKNGYGLCDTSADGFITTYQHLEYPRDDENTFIYFNRSENIIAIQNTIVG